MPDALESSPKAGMRRRKPKKRAIEKERNIGF
jgi:hypothetical protein